MALSKHQDTKTFGGFDVIHSFLITTLDVTCGQLHAPSFYPGTHRLWGKEEGSHSGSGHCSWEKNLSPLPGIEHLLSSLKPYYCIDWAIPLCNIKRHIKEAQCRRLPGIWSGYFYSASRKHCYLAGVLRGAVNVRTVPRHFVSWLAWWSWDIRR